MATNARNTVVVKRTHSIVSAVLVSLADLYSAGDPARKRSSTDGGPQAHSPWRGLQRCIRGLAAEVHVEQGAQGLLRRSQFARSRRTFTSEGSVPQAFEVGLNRVVRPVDDPHVVTTAAPSQRLWRASRFFRCRPLLRVVSDL